MFVFLPGKTGATVHLLFKMWLFSDILCLLWLVTWFFLKIIQISEYTELCVLSSNFLFHRIKRIFSLLTKRKKISKSLHLTKPEPEKKIAFWLLEQLLIHLWLVTIQNKIFEHRLDLFKIHWKTPVGFFKLLSNLVGTQRYSVYYRLRQRKGRKFSNLWIWN